MEDSRRSAARSRQYAVGRRQKLVAASCLLPAAFCLMVSSGCGYTTRPGLPAHLKTVYVKPFVNKIDVTRLSSGNERFPIYRHQMEVDLTRAVISRYQFTGLLRPARVEQADCRLEGELTDFRRDALRYNASSQVEEWRLSLVVNLRFVDQTADIVLWEEGGFMGDTTYFVLGSQAESESAALDRALTDLARRIVERSVESW